MDTIRQIATSICITMVATGIFSMLVPNRSMQKTLKFTISLFFLCCVVIPFVDAEIEWESLAAGASTDEQVSVSYEEQVNKQLLEMTKSNLSENIRQELERSGIEAENVVVSAHIDEMNSISINEINLVLRSGDAAQAEKIVKDLFDGNDVAVFAQNTQT